MMRIFGLRSVVVVGLVALGGLVSVGSAQASYRLPPTGLSQWYWEINPPSTGLAGLPAVNGAYPSPRSANIWDTDLFQDSNTPNAGIPTGPSPVVSALHAAGHYSICYVEAGSYQVGFPDNANFAVADYGGGLAVFQKNDGANAPQNASLYDRMIIEECNYYQDPCTGTGGDASAYLATHDSLRSQLARNIDCLAAPARGSHPVLGARDPERSFHRDADARAVSAQLAQPALPSSRARAHERSSSDRARPSPPGRPEVRRPFAAHRLADVRGSSLHSTLRLPMTSR